MNDCTKEKFIHNEEIKTVDEFDSSIFSVGITLYEVVRLMEGIPVFFEDHIKRIYHSATLTGKKIWLSAHEIRQNINLLCELNDAKDGNVKFLFNFHPRNLEDDQFIAYFVKHHYPTSEQYIKGVSTAFFHAERYNPNAKIFTKILKEEADNAIKETNVYDVLLVDRGGYITEGSRSNVFFIKNDKIYTAPTENVLPGITREYVIAICKEFGLQLIAEKTHYTKIKTMNAVFISGTSPKVLPVKQIDAFSFEVTNPLMQFIMKQYDKLVIDYCNHHR